MAKAKDVVRHHDPTPGDNPWVHGQPPLETIEVVSYEPCWPEIYKELAEAIKKALGQAALTINHIGSTAVTGLAAKPVIDIDLTVNDPTDEAAYCRVWKSRVTTSLSGSRVGISIAAFA